MNSTPSLTRLKNAVRSPTVYLCGVALLIATAWLVGRGIEGNEFSTALVLLIFLLNLLFTIALNIADNTRDMTSDAILGTDDINASGDRTPVSLKILHPLAQVPAAARRGDAGFDLRSVIDVTLAPGDTFVVPTGIALEIPEGTVALVCSRSGLAAKNSIAVLNAPGVVDSGYRGEILVVLHNHGTTPFPVNVGDRVAQLMIQEYLTPHFTIVDELGESERGTRGKGSTGVA